MGNNTRHIRRELFSRKRPSREQGSSAVEEEESDHSSHGVTEMTSSEASDESYKVPSHMVDPDSSSQSDSGPSSRPQALRKSEEMLVEDTAQFEAFLKQNDEKVQEALKKAEQQTKLKQDKLADIKRLNASMATIKKDLNKFQEQLDECKKYKDFILSLTPKDWLDATSKTAVESTKRKSETVETGDVSSGGEIAMIDSGGEEVDANTREKMYFQSPNQSQRLVGLQGAESMCQDITEAIPAEWHTPLESDALCWMGTFTRLEILIAVQACSDTGICLFFEVQSGSRLHKITIEAAEVADCRFQQIRVVDLSGQTWVTDPAPAATESGHWRLWARECRPLRRVQWTQESGFGEILMPLIPTLVCPFFSTQHVSADTFWLHDERLGRLQLIIGKRRGLLLVLDRLLGAALGQQAAEEDHDVSMACRPSSCRSGELLVLCFFCIIEQLLEIFRELEEKNLLLMQESQDVETSLENLKAKFNDTKVNNESKIASLQSQLQAIKAAIKTEEERQSNLQTKTNVNMIDKTYNVSFDEIASKVTEVYVRCGLEDDPALGTLQKLTSIEAKLEESISALVGVPPEFIEQTEKSREKQRRLALREEKMEKQRMEQEKRAERSLERAHAPIPRKTGKPVMFRSRLSKKKKMQVTEVKTDEDKELTEFLERDY
ncbi:hypothetical protein L7F22_051474 [Adiantum nelumboides]|nr:hypothetical protein [Adiantum nelumboides]